MIRVTMPGYKHLQMAYQVERNGELVLVPTEQLTEAEARWLAAEERRKAAECERDAEELRAELRRRRG